MPEKGWLNDGGSPRRSWLFIFGLAGGSRADVAWSWEDVSCGEVTVVGFQRGIVVRRPFSGEVSEVISRGV